MAIAALALIDGIQDGWYLYHSGVVGFEGLRFRVNEGLTKLTDVNNETWQLLPGEQPRVGEDTLAKMRASGSDAMGLKKGMQLMMEALIISSVGSLHRPHDGHASQTDPGPRNREHHEGVDSIDVDLATHLGGEALAVVRKIASMDGIRPVGVMGLGFSPEFSMMNNGKDEDANYTLFALAQVIRCGSKLIRLARVTARSFLDIDLRLSLSEYGQPFEATGVIIPSGSIDGINVDLVAASFCRPDWGFCVSAVNVGAGLGFLERFLPMHQEVTIEETLEAGHDLSGLEDENRRQARDLVRIVMNACLFAVERGTRPVQPKTKFKPPAQRRNRQRDRERRGIAEPSRFQLFEIQDMPFMPSPAISGVQSGEDSRSQGGRQPMHRRRGHWKMQPYGPGRSKRRRIFVQGYMVNDQGGGEVETILS